MDELFNEIADFLSQEVAVSTDPDIEIHYEIDCQLCAEDGFAQCQGHPYSKSADAYLD